MKYIKCLKGYDFTLVELRITNECSVTPHCKIHGAMVKTSESGLWRCISSAGYKIVSSGKSIGKKHIENTCNAACIEISYNAETMAKCC